MKFVDYIEDITKDPYAPRQVTPDQIKMICEFVKKESSSVDWILYMLDEDLNRPDISQVIKQCLVDHNSMTLGSENFSYASTYVSACTAEPAPAEVIGEVHIKSTSTAYPSS